MRLKKIKLSGFKSFVDPTSIPVSSNLIGVVGPNGCGKSNIIDAVRWVMGESSAKHLRGDSMADVIFSGSNTRKPVGTASVELVFDNSDGKASGQYAAYAEISIRREASRDGQSLYYLNKTRCRRKDITDLFLGTGLGPRTYSIIEQGMVTRIVEAKPEELRGFLEEAAGISKYKERRRETENRIRHTRENLDRVQDIRNEMETQLRKLQRQSKAAAKYKDLKQEERLLHAQLLALRWQELSGKIQGQESDLSSKETELEGMIAQQREIEAKIEDIRSHQAEANESLNRVQGDYYSLGAEISGVEQKIQHTRETRQQWLREQQQVNQSWEEASQHLQSDKRLYAELEAQQQQAAPDLATRSNEHTQASETQKQAEQAMHDWQAEWQRFNEVAAEPAKVRDIQQARIEQLTQTLDQVQQRQGRVTQELETIEQELAQHDIDSLRQQTQQLDQDYESHEQQLEQKEEDIKQARNRNDVLVAEIEQLNGRYQNNQARLTSLQELQAAAQGKDDQALNDWLQQRGLHDAARLAARINVEGGWERAVEQVLGTRLAAVCVDDLSPYAQDVAALRESELMLLDSAEGGAVAASTPELLLHKIQSDMDMSAMLAGIYVVETLDAALAMRPKLSAAESVVTRDGIWLGQSWLRISSQEGVRAGMLQREREIEQLQQDLAHMERELEQAKTDSQEVQQQIVNLETQRDDLRKRLGELNRERNEAHNQFGHKEARHNQLIARQQQIQQEQQEIQAQVEQHQNELQQSQQLLQEAEGQSGSLAQRRQELEDRRDQLRQDLDTANRNLEAAREALHKLEIDQQRMNATFESTKQSVERLETQLQNLISRREELDELLAQGEAPEVELKQQLETLLQQRVALEGGLSQAREAVETLESQLRDQEQARARHEKLAQGIRQDLEQLRMQRQELNVRRETLEEQVCETHHQLDEVLEGLPQESSRQEWEEQLEKIGRRIERLGPINLVAIEEFEEQSERKGYLDKQYEDLTQALTTLEDAIRKIDRESRTRFKETFDQVNSGLQSFFPRLFGGGHAYLELTEEDLLQAGVAVMARPPGKRNSTIHLLSGGEKALTAVALVFSIFQLNPAPFCFLDEVDAPLDDANVERYSKTLKEMSKETQLLYVTHNKLSMEVAEYLLGVTMAEPGVSRLVTVDVDEAMEMVV